MERMMRRTADFSVYWELVEHTTEGEPKPKWTVELRQDIGMSRTYMIVQMTFSNRSDARAAFTAMLRKHVSPRK